MDWNDIEADWQVSKENIRQKWNKITDDELDQMKGQREKLEALLQQRYGRSEEQAHQEVDLWLKDTRLRLHS